MPAVDPTMEFINIYESAQAWTNSISLPTEAASFLSNIKDFLSSAWESLLAYLSLPHVYWALIAFAITFTVLVTLVLSLGFGPGGVVFGSLAAAFQSSMYGGFTPAGGLFATLTSLGMLGFFAPAVTVIAAAIAFSVALLPSLLIQD
ncbi:hypothetical protein DL766_004033 [Monosporascus sp. MC13-8B]|uniref:Uncharacterized protein n=1 Tax=Monosporascus cannonballus TaxID=155416 RepID=A0ABY0HCY8_9PEZI|nr:hypothetical protein DL762_002637 [Monosporascus cannonballus]RYO92062.1 hypothetical protein DL763_004818 [Monosporascus cannonballus]RYP32276.1 hypothetical protein DL766_004033 [Monosporascus sp. MC13-8B]